MVYGIYCFWIMTSERKSGSAHQLMILQYRVEAFITTFNAYCGRDSLLFDTAKNDIKSHKRFNQTSDISQTIVNLGVWIITQQSCHKLFSFVHVFVHLWQSTVQKWYTVSALMGFLSSHVATCHIKLKWSAPCIPTRICTLRNTYKAKLCCLFKWCEVITRTCLFSLLFMNAGGGL